MLRSITAANLSVATDAGNIQIGDANASAPSLIKLSGDATLRSGSSIVVQGGAQGAQAELSADGQISLFVNAPDLELRSGGSFARIVNPTNQFALKLGLPTPLAINATTGCTICAIVSPFEITSSTISEVIDVITASILGMNPIPEPKVTKESEGEIEVDAGETCK